MRYNVTFITDRVTIATTVEADDRDEAHNQGIETINYELGLNLSPDEFDDVEIENLDDDEEED